jgi:hypothetical protein
LPQQVSADARLQAKVELFSLASETKALLGWLLETTLGHWLETTLGES